jgi:RNase P subunit RPR2
MKQCRQCNELLPLTSFAKHRGRPDGLQGECKECQKKRKIPREYQLAYRAKNKSAVFEHYAQNGEIKCARCGFSDTRALSIDHINGKGAQHRKQIGKHHVGSVLFYSWLVRHDFPEGFQILCMNCQWIKRAENNEANITPIS